MQINQLFYLILSLIMLFNWVESQQICLQQQCKPQLDACKDSCQKLLAQCTFDCTMGSQGCMQDCVSKDKTAKSLLYCSFDKCINL